jgi:hypothetical protein
LTVAAVSIVVTIAARPAHAGLTVGATGTNDRAAVSTNLTPSWSTTTTSGSLLTAIVTLRGTSSTTITPPAVTGTAWTLAARADQGTVSVAIYYIPNATNTQGTTAQNWAISGSNAAAIRLREYKGAATTSPLDQTGTGTGSSATAAVSTGTLAQAAEFAVVGVVTNDVSSAAPSGYTQAGTQTTKPNGNPGVGVRITETTHENTYTGGGTQSVSSTLGGSAAWGAVIATFKIPTKYWIGGCTGNAFDLDACWSSSSGGAANTTAPGSTDDVVFDGAGLSSPVMPTSVTVNSIDLKPAYTGTVTVGTGKTLVINTSLAVEGGTFTGGGTVTFSTATLNVSGGTMNGGGSAMSPSSLVVSGGTLNTGSGTLSTSTVTMSGGTVLTAGTFTASGAATISGGTFTSGAATTTFASLALSGTGGVAANTGNVTANATTMTGSSTFTGAGGSTSAFSTLDVGGTSVFNTNGGTATFSGALTISGGTYRGTSGTSTLSSTLTVSSGTFDLNGGTMTCAGTGLVSGGTYYGAGTSTFTRSGNGADALQITGGTFDLNGGTLNTTSTSRSGLVIGGGTYYGTNGTTTIGYTLEVTSGTYDAAGGSSSVGGTATISGGTYKIGSSATGQTMSNGMTVSGGTLDGSSSTGALKIASGRTLSMTSGRLQTSSGSIAGPTFGIAATAWTFTITGGTVSLNGGKVIGTTGTNGMNIGTGATISQLDYVEFDNTPASNVTAYQLSISQNTLNLRSTGCKFEYNTTTFSNTKNVRLTDAGTGTDVRAWFQLKDTSTNGVAAGDTYDADEDTSPDDGVGDTGNRAVLYWSYAVATDTAGAITGVPTAAFDWNTGAFYSTYAVFNDISGANTTDRIYVRDANGLPVSSFDISDSNSSIVGTPLWTTESSVHVLYVATTAGKIYRLVDTAGTLTASTGTWAGGFSDGSVTAISSPLVDDGTNLYFGGTYSGANEVIGVSKSTKTVARHVGAAASVTATPSWKISSGTTNIFVGTTAPASQAYVYRIAMTPTAMIDATSLEASAAIGAATRYASGYLYAGDGNGKLHSIDALAAGINFKNRSGFPYQDTLVSRHATATVGAIQGTPWVDTSGYIFFGDNDGHLYKLNFSGVLEANYPIRLTATNQLRVSPIYIAGSGVLLAGDSGGNVYYVDIKNASSAPAVFYTTTLSGAVSSISYNGTAGQFMVGTSAGIFEMLPAKADPTPTFVQ